MPRKQKKYHYIYKTTNLINGKYYIGMHTTNDLIDGYIGSGKRLWYSINKYGKENFKCEILEMLPDREKLKEREKELVNEDLLKDLMCMNLREGGIGGGFTKEQQINNAHKSNKKQKWLMENDKEWAEKRTIERKKNGSNVFKKLWLENKLKPYNTTGLKHSEETKQKIGLSNSIKQKGNLNSQFGTRWITNGVENKKIKKEDMIPEGWQLGRI